MERSEALIIAGLALEVDGGCTSCAAGLLANLQWKFSDFDWTALAIEADPDRAHWFADDVPDVES